MKTIVTALAITLLLCSKVDGQESVRSTPILQQRSNLRFEAPIQAEATFGQVIAQLSSSKVCFDDAGLSDQDWGPKKQCRYTPPYISNYRSTLLNGSRPVLLDWVRTDKFDSGREIAASVKEKSQLGPYDCGEKNCLWITRPQREGEAYSLCEVIKNEFIPTGCTPLLLESNGVEWLSAVVGLSEPEAPHPPLSVISGVPDSVFIFNIHFNKHLLTDDAVSASVRQALTTPRLSLVEGMSTLPGLISATSLPRYSSVNSNRWELAEVHVETVAMPDRHIGVSYDLYYHVNDSNTDRPNDWHTPTENEKSRFLSEIAQNLKSALSRLCPLGTWSGNVLKCD